jgi:hypothetical protein
MAPYDDVALESSLKTLVDKGTIGLHKSLKLEGHAFKLVFSPKLEIQFASGKKLAALTRDEEEERPQCLVMRGAEGNNLFKVIMPGTSGLTPDAIQLGLLHMGSLYAGVKGDSLAFVTHLIVAN